jgi:hypothetical protein
VLRRQTCICSASSAQPVQTFAPPPAPLHTGSTTHVYDPATGRVVEHIEEWDTEPGKVRALSVDAEAPLGIQRACAGDTAVQGQCAGQGRAGQVTTVSLHQHLCVLCASQHSLAVMPFQQQYHMETQQHPPCPLNCSGAALHCPCHMYVTPRGPELGFLMHGIVIAPVVSPVVLAALCRSSACCCAQPPRSQHVPGRCS